MISGEVRRTKNALQALKAKYAKANFEGVARAALLHNLPRVQALLVLYSGGTQYQSLATLKNMGHPYGYNSTAGLPQHAGIINRQTGQLFESLHVSIVRTAKFYTYRVDSGDWRARAFPAGTDKMIPRPWRSFIHRKINEEVMPYVLQEIRTRLRKR
jgi:hypothetical protein